MANVTSGFLKLVIYSNSILIIYMGIINSSQAWDIEDYELFDLVEEMNKTFYEVLGLEKTASSSEIRKQYYKMSLKLHPDHNQDPNAEQQFRQLVSISDVLRDESKRKKYDNILENGLPDWKHAIFYYRKVRKFGLLELCTILFAIITVGQYIVSWAIYLERKYEMEEVLFSKLKKKDRKSKKSKQMGDDTKMEMICEEVMSQLQKPRFLDLLPFAMVRGSITFVIKIPHGYSLIRQEVETWYNRPNLPSEDSTDVVGDEERIRKPRRKRILEIPTSTSECILESVDEPALNDTSDAQIADKEESLTVQNQSKYWTDEDVAALTKAMNKFPSGIPQRWEKIASQLNRTLQDVTSMTKTLKSANTARVVPVSLQGLTASKLSHHSVDVDELTEREPPCAEEVNNDASITDSKNSRKGCDSANEHKPSELQSKANIDISLAINGTGDCSEELWTQVQQKALELALSHFPRGVDDRWEKVAKCVPDKSMEECMRRYKRLVELVKKKRLGTDK